MPIENLKCCVIDDEPLAAQLIQSYIERTPFCSVAGVFHSAQDAIKTIISGEVDVVYLDIQMPQISGMEFAKIVPAGVRIIFTTAYEQHAVEGFRANALDYLLKPVSYAEFLDSANRALEWKLLRTRAGVEPGAEVTSQIISDYLVVKSDYKLIQIATNDILFIEGLKDYVKIYPASGGPCIISLLSLRALEASLPSPQFLRVHRSYIVNTTYIRVIERNRIIFDRKSIPVSETYKARFQAFLGNRTVSTLTLTELEPADS